MKNKEINGNLCDIPNYDIFFTNIIKVIGIFTHTFGTDIMEKIDLYVDNAVNDSNSGYTPITTPILKKYIIIKLNIEDFSRDQKIVYQFSHELCHYVFYALKGFDKENADVFEENICSAMSLIILRMLYSEDVFEYWLNYVKNLADENYRGGFDVAREVEFDINKLKQKIYQICNNSEQN